MPQVCPNLDVVFMTLRFFDVSWSIIVKHLKHPCSIWRDVYSPRLIFQRPWVMSIHTYVRVLSFITSAHSCNQHPLDFLGRPKCLTFICTLSRFIWPEMCWFCRAIHAMHVLTRVNFGLKSEWNFANQARMHADLDLDLTTNHDAAWLRSLTSRAPEAGLIALTEPRKIQLWSRSETRPNPIHCFQLTFAMSVQHVWRQPSHAGAPDLEWYQTGWCSIVSGIIRKLLN